MKVHLRTLGCRLNQSEIDTMARQFRAGGHDVVENPAEADWIVINTCTVTNDAARSSRHLTRDLHAASPNAQISVTGCYAQIAPDEIAVLPGVQRVVDNLSKDRLVEIVTGQPTQPLDAEPLARTLFPGAIGRTRAFVKAQDGCDNACTFCVTTIARGAGRSRALADVVAEIRHLRAAGCQEAVLTGVHLGSYGHDWGQYDGLTQLVTAILADTDIPRLRLSSLEPWDLTPQFFDLWANRRLCRHLHLPLQSGCDATLKRMRRRTTEAQFSALVMAARERVPGLSITTDVMVGFPGETEAEFALSQAFIEQMDFAGLHVFRYSRRPGTSAARMRGQIPEDVKKRRSVQLIAWSEGAERRFAQRFQGHTLSVLWENIAGATPAGFINVGYTDNYIRVRSVLPRVLTNYITPVQLFGYDQASAQVAGVPEITPLPDQQAVPVHQQAGVWIMDDPKVKLQAALKEAMVTKDNLRRDVIRFALSAIKQVEIDTRKELTAEETVAVLQKEAKKRRETIDEIEKAGRAGAEQERRELSFLEEFLPRQLSRDELAALVREAIAQSGATSAKEMGKVMAVLMPKVKGLADGKLVNEVVRELLSS